MKDHRCHGSEWIRTLVAAACCTRLLVQAALVDLPVSTDLPSPSVSPLKITYPSDGTIFPPEIIAPTVRWTDSSLADTWTAALQAGDGSEVRSSNLSVPRWSPEAAQWERIKQCSLTNAARLKITGYRRFDPGQVLSEGQARFQTSIDPVGAAIFYREVILPFIEAVKDPAQISWRLGTVADANPPVVLHGLPACGNCHSFPKDGSVLAMDVDYANSKGSYIIAPVARQLALRPQDIITWDDFRRGDGDQTFGLLSQISPDGQVVVSTVKDRSVFVPKPGLEFSQLFFPIKGILATYDRRSKAFQSVPGADDPAYVQSNPTWSPDGQEILFARAPAYQLRASRSPGRALLTPEECDEFLREGKPFRFDLYRVPYNAGRGGKPRPVPGASGDGFSHFFPRYSPDGKWIVFCRARNYMLLQPDSELWLIPAGGGTARRLGGNTARMNSWHSWSPNGRWLVFSSKVNGPYTELFLTHIDGQGNSSPAVELAQFTAPNRAANIPEFVSFPAGSLEHIEPHFLDDYTYARAGFVCEQAGDLRRAVDNYRQALSLNPDNFHAHERLGYVLCTQQRDYTNGLSHCRAAVRLKPDYGQGHFVLGCVLFARGDMAGAVEHLTASLPGMGEGTDPNYTPVAVHSLLGSALFLQRDNAASARHFREALRLRPGVPDIRLYLAIALARQGLIEEAQEHHRAACQLKPELARNLEWYNLLSLNLAKAGRLSEAAEAARQGSEMARQMGDQELERDLADRMRRCRSGRF